MGLLVFQQTSGGVINVQGTNTASTFTWTVPASTDTFVGLAATQTLTNKTLTGPVISSWTTSGRPGSPSTGEIGYNSTYGGLEVYNGTAWDTITGGPTFSYYQSSAQTLSTTTFTKLTFTSSEWDTTNGMYSSSRFTPTIPGYYQINGAMTTLTTQTTAIICIYKNGSQYKQSLQQPGGVTWGINALVYCNGSTDYIELYGYLGVGATLYVSNPAYTWFQCSFVRSA